jgi:hypothetical protein
LRNSDCEFEERLSDSRVSGLIFDQSAINSWSGRTELNPYSSGFPGLGCLRYNTPRFAGFKFQVHSFKFASET